LRHDARTELSEREFQEVQQLLAAACSTMSTWLLHHAGARSFQIAAAHELASTGLDQEHAFIRRAGADVALLAAGVRIRSRTRLVAGESCDLTELDVTQLHAFTDPRPAALHLARQLTGLAEDLLGLVTGDQIGDDQILNCRVPEAALPILRALDRGFGQVLNGPRFSRFGLHKPDYRALQEAI
jgi:hypothetical protein